MSHIVSSVVSLFNGSRINLKKHLTSPRDMLFDVERQLARQLRVRLSPGQRVGEM